MAYGNVFGFGLLHGLGFASVLSEFGLPEGQYIPALIGFNVGVEFGQLSVIAIAYLLLALPFGRSAYYRARVTIPASASSRSLGFGGFWSGHFWPEAILIGWKFRLAPI